MKKLICLPFLFLIAASCMPGANGYHVPQGYQTCRTSMDCPRGTYCGFVEVDSYAVCKH